MSGPVKLKRPSVPRRFALPQYTTPARTVVNKTPLNYYSTGNPMEVRPSNWLNSGSEYAGPDGEVADKDLHPALSGTRLATALREIEDRFSQHDPRLAALANAALHNAPYYQGGPRGSSAGSIIEAPKDRFAEIHRRLSNLAGSGSGDHASRAGQLAKQFNWHRVGDALKLDQAVGDYLDSIKDRGGRGWKEASARNEHRRLAHNMFGLAAQHLYGTQPDMETAVRVKGNYDKFWNGMLNHLRTNARRYGIGAAKLSKQDIMKSIRRLGEAEERVYGRYDKGSDAHRTAEQWGQSEETSRPEYTGRIDASGAVVSKTPRPRLPEYAPPPTGLRAAGAESPVPVEDFTHPAHSVTKAGGLRAHPKAVAAQYRRLKRPGIPARYTVAFRPGSGRYAPAAALAAGAEHSTLVRLLMNEVINREGGSQGLTPERMKVINSAAGSLAQRIREHVAANPDDPHVTNYLSAASEALGQAAADPEINYVPRGSAGQGSVGRVDTNLSAPRPGVRFHEGVYDPEELGTGLHKLGEAMQPLLEAVRGTPGEGPVDLAGVDNLPEEPPLHEELGLDREGLNTQPHEPFNTIAGIDPVTFHPDPEWDVERAFNSRMTPPRQLRPLKVDVKRPRRQAGEQVSPPVAGEPTAPPPGPGTLKKRPAPREVSADRIAKFPPAPEGLFEGRKPKTKPEDPLPLSRRKLNRPGVVRRYGAAEAKAANGKPGLPTSAALREYGRSGDPGHLLPAEDALQESDHAAHHLLRAIREGETVTETRQYGFNQHQPSLTIGDYYGDGRAHLSPYRDRDGNVHLNLQVYSKVEGDGPKHMRETWHKIDPSHVGRFVEQARAVGEPDAGDLDGWENFVGPEKMERGTQRSPAGGRVKPAPPYHAARKMKRPGTALRYGAAEDARALNPFTKHGSHARGDLDGLIHNYAETRDDTYLGAIADLLQEQSHPFHHVLNNMVNKGPVPEPEDWYTWESPLYPGASADSRWNPEVVLGKGFGRGVGVTFKHHRSPAGEHYIQARPHFDREWRDRGTWYKVDPASLSAFTNSKVDTGGMTNEAAHWKNSIGPDYTPPPEEGPTQFSAQRSPAGGMILNSPFGIGQVYGGGRFAPKAAGPIRKSEAGKGLTDDELLDSLPVSPKMAKPRVKPVPPLARPATPRPLPKPGMTPPPIPKPPPPPRL